MIGQKLAHYRIIDVLGAGALGTVYSAEDLNRPRLVALRILPRELARNGELLRRFDAILAALAGLDHPGIVRVLERGEDQAFQFVTMPLVDGQTLEARLRPGPLPLPDAIRVATEVAEALVAIHAAGVAHTDLRPQNVMISPRGVRLLNVGMPHDLLPASAALARQRAPYLSPEILRGARPDGAGDLYALGVMLYEMVTGRRPFSGESPQSVARAVMEGRPDLPCSLRDGVPLSLERTILKALAREPVGRHCDAEEFLAELRQAGDDLNALELTHLPLVRRRRRHFGTLLPTLAAILFLGIILLIARLFQLHGR